MSDPSEEMTAVVKRGIDTLTARDGRKPCMDDLIIHLAVEIVARDRTIAEFVGVSADRISAKLNDARGIDRDRFKTALQRVLELWNRDSEACSDHSQVAFAMAETARKALIPGN